MKATERLIEWATAVKRWLGARAPAGVWLVAAVVAATLVWGAVDPFRLRQRLDRLLCDQFLASRRPPPVHPDLLQVSIDDEAAIELGKEIPRSVMAAAIRQLRRLGARTVLIDVIYTEPDERLAYAEAERWFVPRELLEQDPRLRERFTEDLMFARELAVTDRVGIAFYLQPPRPSPPDDEAIVARMSGLLGADWSLTADTLATRVGVSAERARRLFTPALQHAMGRLAVKLLDEQPDVSREQALERVFPDPDPHSALVRAFSVAFNETLSRRALAEKAAVAVKMSRHLHAVTATDKLQAPHPQFTAAAGTLGFADAELDGDGTLRRLPVVARWGDRAVFHQSLLAALRHQGHDVAQLRSARGALRTASGAVSVPVDSYGRLVVNWPISRRVTWETAIPQISLFDLYRLELYEFGVAENRRRLYFRLTQMDEYTGTQLGLAKQFERFELAYQYGRLEEITELEREFLERALPQIIGHPKVQEAAEQARTTRKPTTDEDPEPPLVQMARDLDENRERAPALETEYRAVFEDLKRRVEGKLCLIGESRTGSVDWRETSVAVIPGISVNASAVNTILTGRFLTEAGYVWSAGLTVLVTVPLSIAFLRSRAYVAALFGVLGVLAVLFGTFGLLQSADVLLSPVSPIAGLLASQVSTATYRWWQENKQRRQLHRAFQFYLHPAVVDQVSKNPELLRLGGEQQELTVLFSDIRGFSTFSEGLSPQQLVRLLNRYLTAMTEFVLTDGGCLDKYIGDAIMAIYGAPLSFPDHAYQACHTALKMIEQLRPLRDTWQREGFPRIDIGIGINTGKMVVGNMGSDMRFDYTVMGDEVNLASRLEGVNKEYGTHIIISESTWEKVKDRIATRELDIIQVKGKKKPTQIFEVLGLLPLDGDPIRMAGLFEQGIAAYRDRHWQEAIRLFHESLGVVPDDFASRLYIRRCEQFLAAPPPDDWDGVYQMKTK